MNVQQAKRIVGDIKEGRPEYDFYPTSPESTLALLQVEKFNGKIWECACGKGDMSEVLIDNGYDVISTDLIDYGYGIGKIDFLRASKLLAPNIITNPPFKLATEFAKHAMDLGVDKLCLLLKLAFLEGRARKKFFAVYPPKWVHVFSKRVLLTRNGEPPHGSGMIAFAWFVWEKGYKDFPRINWI